MSERAIKIPYALKGGEQVHVDDVESGLACGCNCPKCNELLIAHKGDIRVHHFAHKTETNCSGESILHYWAKKFLAERILNAIEDKRALPFQWQCDLCPDTHSGNLTKKASNVYVEKQFYECRPDIAITNEHDEPVIFIEIVVSHKPEDSVREYSKTKKIGLVEFHLTTVEQLDDLKTAVILTASKVYPCVRPKCKNCGEIMKREVLFLFEAPCWKCHTPMKIAQYQVDGCSYSVRYLNKRGLEKARDYGVILKQNYSDTTKERYLSNTCGKCKKFIGDFYSYDYLEYTIENNAHQIGFVCTECDDRFKETGVTETPPISL